MPQLLWPLASVRALCLMQVESTAPIMAYMCCQRDPALERFCLSAGFCTAFWGVDAAEAIMQIALAAHDVSSLALCPHHMWTL